MTNAKIIDMNHGSDSSVWRQNKSAALVNLLMSQTERWVIEKLSSRKYLDIEQIISVVIGD